MKQKTILIVLALCMCTIGADNINAQTKKPIKRTTTQVRKASSSTRPASQNSREYKVENDGFEWYLVCKNGKYGAESRDGQTLVPTEYSQVFYFDGGINVWMGKSVGYYNTDGKCIIPVSRNYSIILKEKRGFGVKYDILTVRKYINNTENGEGICDMNGKEIIYLEGYCHLYPCTEKDGTFYFEFSNLDNPNTTGIADGKGRIIVKPRKSVEGIVYDNKARCFKNYNGKQLSEGYLDLTYNPLAGSKNHSLGTTSSNSSSSPLSSSNNNSGGGATTIVVEQHGPVQVWVACGGCQLSPGRCSYCNGSGWGYNNRLCSRCNGTGKCTICNGTGGHNEVQYR